MMITTETYICLLIILFGLVLCDAQGQNTIKGTIKNAETKQALEGANIFLDNTTTGTETDGNGHFELSGIPDGSYTLVISFVGFKSVTKKLSFPAADGQMMLLKLKPKSNQLAATVVEAPGSKKWKRNYRRFKDYFLGHTKNAAATTILNPQALEFNLKGDRFIATTSGPLVIRNNALGYYIRVNLKKFTYKNRTSTSNMHAKFTSMQADDKQTKAWIKARLRTYKGSFRHFIDALISDSLHEDGFVLSYVNNATYKSGHIDRDTPTNLTNTDELFKHARSHRIIFSFARNYPFIQVDYLNEFPESRIVRLAHYDKHYHQVSFIGLPNGKAVIDSRSSSQIAPYKANLYGYWGWTSHLPDQLPKNYHPKDN